MEGVALKKIKLQPIDSRLCIICQKNSKQTLTSTLTGQQKIIEVAKSRNDNVYTRIQQIPSGKFFYHMNYECYKKYVHFSTPNDISDNSTPADVEVDVPTTPSQVDRKMRSKSTPRPPPDPDQTDMYSSICVICGNKSHKRIYEKNRICEEDRAKKFLNATLFFKDSVYTRVCDLEDVNRVFGADLLCHKDCIKSYIIQYERALKDGKNVAKVTMRSEREKVFKNMMEDIEKQLKSGVGYPLTDLRIACNNELDNDKFGIFDNKELKVLLHNHFEDDISFSFSDNLRQSCLVYHNNIDKNEIVEQVRNSNPVKITASSIRTAIVNETSPLKDKFCDANDLSDAWTGMKIPDTILEFLCVLLNVNHKHFYNVDEETPKISPEKRRKIMVLYQIMFFIVNNGDEKMPLQILLAEMIYDACRSKTVITACNHWGLSISYSELLRYRSDMASYVLSRNDNNVPIPSHFEKNLHTTAAFDNFDHNEHTLSGIGSTHDTVSILIQEKTGDNRRKPHISETDVIHGSKHFIGPMPCQEIGEPLKFQKTIEVPSSLNISSELFEMQEDKYQDILKTDVAWLLARLDILKIKSGSLHPSTDQTIPEWSAFNSFVSNENKIEQRVGFLPVLPHPVTKYETVLKSLQNFSNILYQLQQDNMAIFCDEGVYHIAREILLKRPDEFKGLTLCLGSFHLIKTYLACIGKYLRGSGCQTIWIENRIFGPEVVESVLSGSDYVRSMEGILLLGECISRFQWLEFLQNNFIEFKPVFERIDLLKKAHSKKNKEEAIKSLKEFMILSTEMVGKFNKFLDIKSEESETFKYWNNVSKMIQLLRNLVRADREGNWELHLTTVKEIMPMFAIFDRTNYLRWCSLYLEDMQTLNETAPDVYRDFLKGNFSVKRKPGKFNSVGTDMCLEQTINRSSKGKGGVVGETRKKSFFTMWNLIYHEMLEVNNLGREISGAQLDKRELVFHHKDNNADIKRSESNVRSMMEFISSRENPFSVTLEPRLHNILSQQIMTEEIRKDLLNLFENGNESYLEFRKNRFIQKKEKLSDVIHRHNIKTFISIKENKAKTKALNQKTLKTNMILAQKIIDLARVRNFDDRRLFEYNLVSSSYLFDTDGLMIKTDKSSLIREMESMYLLKEHYSYSNLGGTKITYLVDVMSNMRKLSVKTNETFGDLCQSFINYIFSLCKNNDDIHFVFDSYLNGSVKDSERSRRYQTKPIDIHILNSDTPIPVDMTTFWNSNTNKQKLQSLLIENLLKLNNNCIIVSAYVVEDEIRLSQKVGHAGSIDVLNNFIEEADVRLFPHAKYAVMNGSNKITVLSNDTDVIVGLIYHYNEFRNDGLNELWFRAGVGATTRYVPIHTLVDNLGDSICAQLPAMHCLTGHDANSKFGTKLSALKQLTTASLHDFGKDVRIYNAEDMIKEGERYLIQVMKPNSNCKTMNELRYQTYHHKKSSSFVDLPPTSLETKGHCLRAIFNCYQYIYALQYKFMPELDPKEYGYEKVDSLIIPSQYLRIYPEDLIQPCNCKACATSRCNCRSNNLPCCVYCKCSKNSERCQNPSI